MRNITIEIQSLFFIFFCMFMGNAQEVLTIENAVKIALENKYSGFERSDLNFVLALYQQYYYFLVYFFLIIGVIIKNEKS